MLSTQLKKPRLKGTSRFRGVVKRADYGAYRARIWVSGKTIHIGSYWKEDEAARAYDEAALLYFGKDAYLNFPEVACASKL